MVSRIGQVFEDRAHAILGSIEQLYDAALNRGHQAVEVQELFNSVRSTPQRHRSRDIDCLDWHVSCILGGTPVANVAAQTAAITAVIAQLNALNAQVVADTEALATVL